MISGLRNIQTTWHFALNENWDWDDGTTATQWSNAWLVFTGKHKESAAGDEGCKMEALLQQFFGRQQGLTVSKLFLWRFALITRIFWSKMADFVFCIGLKWRSFFVKRCWGNSASVCSQIYFNQVSFHSFHCQLYWKWNKSVYICVGI